MSQYAQLNTMFRSTEKGKQCQRQQQVCFFVVHETSVNTSSASVFVFDLDSNIMFSVRHMVLSMM